MQFHHCCHQWLRVIKDKGDNMKIMFFCFASILTIVLMGCVTNVEGQRTNSKAVAVMATEDIELVVGSGEKLALFTQADKQVAAWAGQSFEITIPVRTAGEIWKIEKISNVDVVMRKNEISYEKEFVFSFDALQSGEARIVFTAWDQESNKVIRYEIVDVNVE